MKFSGCPTNEQWSRLIEGPTDDPSTPLLRSHLETCATCQSRLDALTEPESLTEFVGKSPVLQGDWSPQIAERLNLLGRETGIDLNRALDLSPLATDSVVEDFRIESVLGRGGSGIVYRAWDRVLRRAVALKCLRSDRIDPDDGEALIREARASASLRHDHLVPVYRLGTLPEGGLFLVMPLIEGRSLRRLIEHEGPRPPRIAARYIRQIADALASVHAQGMVHRDVKSGNILIDARDDRAKLSDFGLARLAPLSTLPSANGSKLLGTPEYLCPESLRDPDALNDPRSDVYALGVTLYECLTGTVPFHGQPHRVLHQVLHSEPKPPRELNDTIPRDLEIVCLTAMAPERTQRYLSATAFRDDLDRWLTGQPIQARAATRWERGLKWVRRRPWQAATLATGLCLLVSAVTAALTLRASASRLTQANADLQHARAESEQAFLLSQDALSRVVDRVSETLFEVPNANAVMLDSLRDAVGLHEQLVGLRPLDGEAAERLGKALSSLCTVQMLHGMIPDAEQTLDRYHDFVESRRRREPDDLRIGLRYIDYLRCVETLAIKQGQSGQARDVTDLYRREAERLARLYPESLELVTNQCHILIGEVNEQRRARNYPAALERGNIAIQKINRWRELAPDDPDAANTLAFTLILQARSHEALAEYDQALEAADRAATIHASPVLGELPQREQDWNQTQLLKLQSRIAVSMNAVNADDRLAALESLLRAQLDRHPEEDALREDLILTLIERARRAQAAQDMHADAILEDALQLASSLAADVPEVDRYHDLYETIQEMRSPSGKNQ